MNHYQTTFEEAKAMTPSYINPEDFKAHPWMLCRTGDAHAQGTRQITTVDCPDCMERWTKANMQFTRKDYMAGAVDHDTYYAQFALPEVVRAVEKSIGVEHIIQSADEHFNDISLHKWDRLALGGGFPERAALLVSVSNVSTQAPGSRPSISLSDKVCILKAAARVIRQRESAKESATA